ncbi:MAG: uracil-DNA glycosylase [Arthrobacter sp.]|nr:uracil-DNA glycosylase [Arthrobacter sp.]
MLRGKRRLVICREAYAARRSECFREPICPCGPAPCKNGFVFDSDPLFELEPRSKMAASFAELARLPLAELVAADWATALAPVEGQLREVLRFLAAEADEGYEVLPAPSNVLRAFRQPLAGVRVLIVGQDPYPTPGHAVGLSFAVDGGTRPIPRSLANIYKELEADLGLPPRVHGDLGRWAEQGVLLLNRVLSVRAGAAGSHRNKGWEAITALAINTVVNRTTPSGGKAPLAVILWGKDAASLRPLLGSSAVIASAHPSPLSASRGFFGSRPFSRANALLRDQGNGTVDWELPPLP